MKKMMMILMSVVALTIIGCDSKPSDFDHSSDGWELWREGTIERKKIVMEKYNSSEKRMFVLEFVDGEDVKSSRFYKWDTIKEGDTGCLYCWDGQDCDNTYMWVPKGGKAPTAPPQENRSKLAKQSRSDALIVQKKSVKTYDWQSLMTPPPIHQTVLVKFDNGIVITAHYTTMGEWKSEIDKKKMSGGIPLKKIKTWKHVDLE